MKVSGRHYAGAVASFLVWGGPISPLWCSYFSVGLAMCAGLELSGGLTKLEAQGWVQRLHVHNYLVCSFDFHIDVGLGVAHVKTVLQLVPQAIDEVVLDASWAKTQTHIESSRNKIYTQFGYGMASCSAVGAPMFQCE